MKMCRRLGRPTIFLVQGVPVNAVASILIVAPAMAPQYAQITSYSMIFPRSRILPKVWLTKFVFQLSL